MSAPAADIPRVRVLGVRHHGPGSARAVRRVLDTHRPELVLIEGPADADDMIGWAGRDDMVPPVALLAYDEKHPRRAAYYPMAAFSPEWQALRWAAEQGVEVRFMDLPAAHQLAVDTRPEEPEETEPAGDTGDIGDDPIAVLARAAGHDDPERWWEDLVEHSTDGDPFDALTEAMRVVRDSGRRGRGAEAERTEARREAHMRRVLRAALKSDAERIAVVCGAWHAPALTGQLPTVASDNELLKKLPKVRTTMTWVPWTHSRLALASGYGAGITSPGWYAHLFTAPDRPVIRWLGRVAGALRERDLPVSSAHIIEAVRLAETLAALRGRPLAGLREVTDAAVAVMFDGSQTLRAVIDRELVVGEELGAVAEGTPMVPLEVDLRAEAKRLRLKFSAQPKELTLDLRRDNDRARSRLLHRLAILGIGWGEIRRESGAGTFKEGWTIAWEPEFAVDLVEAGLWGEGVEQAAGTRLIDAARDLPRVTAALERALTAELTDVLPVLLRALDRHAAADADIGHLMAAIPALVRAGRYGTVRGTDTGVLDRVARALLARVRAGLPAAVGGLGEEAAEELTAHIDSVTEVVGLLGEESPAWLTTLHNILDRHDVHARMRGRITRILTDAGHLTRRQAADHLSLAMTGGHEVLAKADWIDGFFSGGALILIHDQTLLPVLDSWLTGLGGEDFEQVVPLLRRTFGAFSRAERANIWRRVGQLGRGPTPEGAPDVADTGTGTGMDGGWWGTAGPALATIRALHTLHDPDRDDQKEKP